jgi:hypothetical protein
MHMSTSLTRYDTTVAIANEPLTVHVSVITADLHVDGNVKLARRKVRPAPSTLSTTAATYNLQHTRPTEHATSYDTRSM